MIRLITFTDDQMTKSADNLWDSAMKHGADAVTIFGPDNLDPVFRNVFLKPDLPARGYGYWRWKPYIILCALANLKEGDFLIYCDAGCTIINNLKYLTDNTTGDFLLFTNGFEHSHWCKGDIQKYVNGDLTIGHKQCQASLSVWKVNKASMDFVKEWYAYSLMPGLIDDSKSVYPNAPEYQENRHDQAILTALAIKYGIKLHWFPSDTNYHQQEDNYPALITHHRKRNNEW